MKLRRCSRQCSDRRDQVWDRRTVYKAYTTHNSSTCSDEGLTLETSAFQSLYGGQFTLSTPLINQIFKFVYGLAVVIDYAHFIVYW